MDVDVRTTRTNTLTKEEREHLQKAGKCFFCKKQGHIARNCPDKPRKPREDKDKGKRPYQAGKAAKVELVDDRENSEEEIKKEESPPTYDDATKVIQQIKRLKAMDREKLFEELAILEDF